MIWESQGITSARYTQTTTTCTGNKWARGRGFGCRSYLDPNMVSGKQTHDTHGRVRARVYAFNQLIRLATSVRPSVRGMRRRRRRKGEKVNNPFSHLVMTSLAFVLQLLLHSGGRHLAFDVLCLFFFHARVHDNGNPLMAPTRSRQQLMVAPFISTSSSTNRRFVSVTISSKWDSVVALGNASRSFPFFSRVNGTSQRVVVVVVVARHSADTRARATNAHGRTHTGRKERKKKKQRKGCEY